VNEFMTELGRKSEQVRIIGVFFFLKPKNPRGGLQNEMLAAKVGV